MIEVRHFLRHFCTTKSLGNSFSFILKLILLQTQNRSSTKYAKDGIILLKLMLTKLRLITSILLVVYSMLRTSEKNLRSLTQVAAAEWQRSTSCKI